MTAVSKLANELRDLVINLNPRNDPFEAIADYVINGRNEDEESGTVQ